MAMLLSAKNLCNLSRMYFNDSTNYDEISHDFYFSRFGERKRLSFALTLFGTKGREGFRLTYARMKLSLGSNNNDANWVL